MTSIKYSIFVCAAAVLWGCGGEPPATGIAPEEDGSGEGVIESRAIGYVLPQTVGAYPSWLFVNTSVEVYSINDYTIPVHVYCGSIHRYLDVPPRGSRLLGMGCGGTEIKVANNYPNTSQNAVLKVTTW